MDILLQRYLSTHSRGLKEFNNMVQSKPTQIRNARNKQIHTFFHTELLPNINNTDTKLFNQAVKDLSKLYRNKDMPVDDTIQEIDSYFKQGGTLVVKTAAETSPKASPKPAAEKPAAESTLEPLKKKVKPITTGKILSKPKPEKPIKEPQSPKSKAVLSTLVSAIRDYLEENSSSEEEDSDLE
jgi:hypothetical protein